MAGRALVTLATIVLTVVLVAGAAAFFVSRDDATVPRTTQSGPGEPRPPGATPAVRPGNIVLLYSDERLTTELRRLAERTAGAPDPALAQAGQAVLLQRRPNLDVAVTAVTARRMLEAAGPDDPALAAFIEYWLGRRE